MNNFAVEQTQSPWLLFLNNDIEVIDGDWLSTMAEHVQRPEVGAVGARLLYPDDTSSMRELSSASVASRSTPFVDFRAEASGCLPAIADDAELQRGYRRMFADAARSF